ncbi:site-specific integrase [Candidatus Bathyarchaeota archaeon]|nr:MAG: site-specific integrase [Candidatus Bathyarchaeota archaeon]
MSRTELLDAYKHNPVLAGETWDTWRTSLEMNNDEETQIIYLRSIIQFLEEYGYTTDSLYDEFIENNAKNGMSKKRIPTKVRQFEQKIISSGLSTQSAKQLEKAFSSFFKSLAESFDMFDLSLEVKNLGGQDKASIQDIKAFMDATDNPRNLAMLSVAKDTGLRSGDICLIDWIDVKPVLDDPSLEFHSWEIQQEKRSAKIPANPCFGRDAIYYLNKYYRWIYQENERRKKANVERLEKNKTRKHKDKLPQLDLIPNGWDDPIFICLVNRHNTEVGIRLNSGSISAEIAKVRNRAGLSGEKISMHSMRKFFHTNMQSAGVSDEWLYKMEGRKFMGSGEAYSRPDYKQLKEIYLKSYYRISLDSANIEAIRERQQLEVDSIRDDVNEQVETNKTLLERIEFLENFIQKSQKQLQESSSNENILFPNSVPTLGYEDEKQIQYLHPDKGIYTIKKKGEEKSYVSDTPEGRRYAQFLKEKGYPEPEIIKKEEKKPEPDLDAILADPELKRKLLLKLLAENDK